MNRLLKLVYTRYVVASLVSLAVDMGVFMAALHWLPASLAAATGYGAGIVSHWLISSRFVFGDKAAVDGNARAQQFGLFVGSALVGLAVTMAIVGTGDAIGIDPRLAKIVAIGASFQLTYWLRRRIVFA